jgi:hypothetical protein
MTNQTRTTRATPQPGTTTTVVRWEFVRGEERMSCLVDRAADGQAAGTFAVIGLPYQRLQRATIEVFHSATAALRRHAALASDLRNAGWKVVAYTN